MRSGLAVSSHNGLIPFETVYEKRGGLLCPISRKKNLICLHSAAFVTILYAILSTPTNFAVISFPAPRTRISFRVLLSCDFSRLPQILQLCAQCPGL